MIGNSGSIIGLIGDTAQSIYEFNGATPRNFIDFTLPNMQKFFISENSRSTPEIINILNKVRPDLQQIPQKLSGNLPKIFVGTSLQKAIDRSQQLSKHPVQILSRTNAEINAIRFKSESTSLVAITDFWNRIDSNPDRHKIIKFLILAIESANSLEFGDAIKSLKRIQKYRKDVHQSQSEILILLKLLKEYSTLTNSNIETLLKRAHDFYNFSNPTKSEIKKFYNELQYNQLACHLDIANNGIAKTIHKAKGEEFESVLLKLKDSDALDFITNPNLELSENHRVHYVAISRAKSQLYIWTPSIKSKDRKALAALFTIEEL